MTTTACPPCPPATTSALDRVLPMPRRVEIDGVDLALSPEEAWQIVRHGNLGESPLARALFALRTLADRLHRKEPEELRLRLDALVSTPERPGFQVLIDEPPFEVVAGAIGQVWRLEIPFVHLPDAAAFAAFAEPGFVKVAWAIRLLPLGERRTHVAIEVRVDATDDLAWRKFRRYFRVIGPASRFIRRSLLASLGREHGHGSRPVPEDGPAEDWGDRLSGLGGAAVMAAALLTPFLRGARDHWGLDAEVAGREYPGDALVPEPRWSWTHGIEIDAPAAEVWPWVAQIGAGRAGFYSYQWLENLAGCQVENAEEIHPEWAVEEGGTLSLHPQMPPLTIAAVEPGHWFVASGPADEAARAAGRSWIAVSWLFLVEPLGERRCRFVSRYRCASSDDLATRLQYGPTLLEPVGFAMDRRMLLGVRQRVMGCSSSS